MSENSSRSTSARDSVSRAEGALHVAALGAGHRPRRSACERGALPSPSPAPPAAPCRTPRSSRRRSAPRAGHRRGRGSPRRGRARRQRRRSRDSRRRSRGAAESHSTVSAGRPRLAALDLRDVLLARSGRPPDRSESGPPRRAAGAAARRDAVHAAWLRRWLRGRGRYSLVRREDSSESEVSGILDSPAIPQSGHVPQKGHSCWKNRVKW